MSRKKITVTLSQPLKVADREFTQITVKEPIANDLRGISITELQMSYGDTVLKLLERVTDIHADNLARLSLGDISNLSNIIVGFLFPKQMPVILESAKESGAEIKVS